MDSLKFVTEAMTSQKRDDVIAFLTHHAIFSGKKVTPPKSEHARTPMPPRLANDVKAGAKVGAKQFNGNVDVCRKTLKSDGIAGLYRGFVTSCVDYNTVNRGFYFGVYDTLKPASSASSSGFRVSMIPRSHCSWVSQRSK